MLQDVINRSDQDPSLEMIPTPLFDFSTDSEFFEGAIFQNSEVSSSSGCGTENISCFDFPTNLPQMDKTTFKYPPQYLVDNIDNKLDKIALSDNVNCMSYMQTRSCPFLANSFFSSDEMMLPGSLLMSSKTESCQGDNTDLSFFGNHRQQSYNHSVDMQSIYGDNQSLNGGGYGNSSQLPSDITSLDESSYKVRKLSMEERRERINRYRKKKNERNFSKKIKYACRKTLADSRPRVRGRFAKNEECGEGGGSGSGSGSGNHDDEDEEEAANKEELMDSISDNYPQFNPFTCDFTTIASWM